MNQVKVKISQELADYIQRYVFEINNKHFILDRLFTKHANDVDDSLLEDRIFKKHIKEYEVLIFSFNEIRNKISRILFERVLAMGINTTYINWHIDDFINDREIIVTYK